MEEDSASRSKPFQVLRKSIHPTTRLVTRKSTSSGHSSPVKSNAKDPALDRRSIQNPAASSSIPESQVRWSRPSDRRDFVEDLPGVVVAAVAISIEIYRGVDALITQHDRARTAITTDPATRIAYSAEYGPEDDGGGRGGVVRKKSENSDRRFLHPRRRRGRETTSRFYARARLADPRRVIYELLSAKIVRSRFRTLQEAFIACQGEIRAA